jgi:hypothetical protein
MMALAVLILGNGLAPPRAQLHAGSTPGAPLGETVTVAAGHHRVSAKARDTDLARLLAVVIVDAGTSSW